MVVGDRQPYIAALITLDPRRCPLGRARASVEMERSSRQQVRELIQGVVDAVNAERSRYEQIKRFTILPRDFTLERRRAHADAEAEAPQSSTQHFGGELDELYAGETLNQAAGIRALSSAVRRSRRTRSSERLETLTTSPVCGAWTNWPPPM